MKRDSKKKHIEVEIAESLGDGSFKTASPTSERKIIACCFGRKSEIQRICSLLTSDDFADPRYKTFFKYVQKTYEEGKLPDRDVCLSQAHRSTEYDIEPEDYTDGLRLAIDGGTECDIEAVCHEIHDLYMVRKFLGLAKKISSNISDGQSTVELVGHAEEAIRHITGEVIRENTLLDIDQLVESSPIGMGAFTDAPMDGIPSPWPTLNEYIYGWRPKQLVIIGARPSTGKTAAVMQIGEHAANLNKDTLVVMFSHEMDPFDLWGRVFCNKVGIKSSDLLHRQLTSSEKDRIADYVKHAAPRNMLISDKGGKTVLSMRAELARIRAKRGPIGMVIIDYLQKMKDPRSRDRFQEVGSISRGLKDTAMELDTRMIAAAQLNRQVDSRPGDNRPKLSDLRESGDIEQDADLAIFLHRPGMYKKSKDGQPDPPDEFLVEKNRRGRTGIIPVRYNGEHYRFQEI